MRTGNLNTFILANNSFAPENTILFILSFFYLKNITILTGIYITYIPSINYYIGR